MAKKPDTGTGVSFADDAGKLEPVDGIVTVDPSSVGNGASDSDSGDGAEPKRKRGRPAGSTNGTRKPRAKTKKKNTSSIGLEKIMFSLHMMAASALKVDELALDEPEAEALANAAQEVASHYNISPDPKVIAWAGLLGVCASIYGPRIAAYKIRTASEKKEKKPTQKQVTQPETEPTEHDPVAPYVEEYPVSNLQ